jgi:hypothetical protein
MQEVTITAFLFRSQKMKKCMTFMLLVSAPIFAQALDSAGLDNSAAVLIHDREKRHEEPREIVRNFWTFSTATLRAGLTGPNQTKGDAIPWSEEDSIHTRGLFLNPRNSTQIVIEHPGLYRVDYNVTGQAPDRSIGSQRATFQFAGYLNGSIINNSIFSPGQIGDAIAEVTGQFLVKVSERFSILQLVNQTDLAVTLINNIGTEDTADFGNNISASILIKKVRD